jgi:hypothetical protein
MPHNLPVHSHQPKATTYGSLWISSKKLKKKNNKREAILTKSTETD